VHRWRPERSQAQRVELGERSAWSDDVDLCVGAYVHQAELVYLFEQGTTLRKR
jgi:hypothetical protein